MNKSTISSEELKRQFAESMPGGIQLFADALGVSTKELLRQVESGKLLAEDVLPLVARQMKNVANNGGALALKLKSARVAQGMFFKEMESGSKLIFDSGFSEGLAEMFREMTEEMKVSFSGMEGLSKVFKLFFKIVGNAVQAIMPLLDSMFYVLGGLAELLIDLFQYKTTYVVSGMGAMSYAVWKLNAALIASNKATKALLANLLRIVAPVVAAFAVIDDLMANFDDQRTSSLEFKMGRQINPKGLGDLVGIAMGSGVGTGLGTRGNVLDYMPAVALYDMIAGREASKPSSKVKVENVVVIDGVISKSFQAYQQENSMAAVE